MVVKVKYHRPLSGDILETSLETNAPIEEIKKLEEFLKNDSSSNKPQTLSDMLMLKGYKVGPSIPDLEIKI